MSWRILGLGALLLWVMTMGLMVALFVHGHTEARNRWAHGDYSLAGGTRPGVGGDASPAQGRAWCRDGAE